MKIIIYTTDQVDGFMAGIKNSVWTKELVDPSTDGVHGRTSSIWFNLVVAIRATYAHATLRNKNN